MAEKAPFVKTLTATTGNVAQGSTDSFSVGEAPFDGEVISVSFTPEAAVTGDDTNKRTYTLVNKGQNGSGTTVIATLDLVSGNNLVAFDEKAFTLSAVEGATKVSKGDIFAFVSTHAGTGLADPGGRVEIQISRR
jgi:hypothetical protein